jgi:hypothetical protein
MNFKEFFKSKKVIKESPDGAYPINGDTFLGWTDKDARSFLIMDDFIAEGSYNKIFHHHMIKEMSDMVIDDIPLVNANTLKVNISVSGEAPTELVDYLRQTVFYGRPEILNALPEVILGRLWVEHKTVSFWNPVDSPCWNMKNIDSLYRLLKKNKIFDPENTTVEILKLGQWLPIPLKNFSNYVKHAELPSEVAPTIMHLLPPEKKGKAMKDAGIMPKQPIDIQAKFKREGD